MKSVSSLLLVVSASSACAAQVPPSDQPACDTTLIQRFDVVRLSGNGVVAGDYDVDEGGWVDVPSLGRISVAGVGPRDLAASLQRTIDEAAPAYAIEDRGRAAVVVAKLPPPSTIRVTGRVEHPGATFPWKRGLTAQQVARRAGVLDAKADPAAYLFRPPCMDATRFGLEEREPIPVHAGDVVFVGEIPRRRPPPP